MPLVTLLLMATKCLLKDSFRKMYRIMLVEELIISRTWLEIARDATLNNSSSNG